MLSATRLYFPLTDLRYLSAPTIAVLHQEDTETSLTEVCDSLPESLVKGLWPGCKIGDNGLYDRAICFQYPANGEAVLEVFAWLKQSVEKGAYQDLSNLTWRRSVMLPRMKEAARVMEIEKLANIVDSAMASAIPDAAETVQK